MSLYCTDEDILAYAPEDIPKALSTVRGNNGEIIGEPGFTKRKNRIITPASVWVDSVFSNTSPFADIGGGEFFEFESDQLIDDSNEMTYNPVEYKDNITVTGTIAITKDSDQLVGTGTSFMNELEPNDAIIIDKEVVYISTIEDDTNATLKNNAPKTVASTSSYTVQGLRRGVVKKYEGVIYNSEAKRLVKHSKDNRRAKIFSGFGFSSTFEEKMRTNRDFSYIGLYGTPPLIRQATIEYAMSLFYVVLQRNVNSDIVRAWKRQAKDTLGVRSEYATIKPHAFIPHNEGYAHLRRFAPIDIDADLTGDRL